MNTNTQRDTDVILQMGKDLEEARELLATGIEAFDALTATARHYGVNPERSLIAAENARAFLARTEPKGEKK